MLVVREPASERSSTDLLRKVSDSDYVALVWLEGSRFDLEHKIRQTAVVQCLMCELKFIACIRGNVGGGKDGHTRARVSVLPF